MELKNITAPLQVRLISTSGQNIEEWKLTKNSILDSQTMSQLPSGIYLLQVINKSNNKVSVYKVFQI